MVRPAAIQVSRQFRHQFHGADAAYALPSHHARPVDFLFEQGKFRQHDAVQITWDHRIADAVVVDRIMSEVESIINNEIVAELTSN
jgi:hypothetical protein